MQKQLFTKFNTYPNLIIGFSDINDGPMKISGNLLKKIVVTKNRNNFFNNLGVNKNNIISPHLTHSNNIEIVAQKDTSKKINNTDGLLTNDKNIFLSVTVADCLPIFIYDPVNEAIGLIHAGWKGLAKDILREAINKLQSHYQSNPENLLIGIGPGISQCHFEVQDDVIENFLSFLPEALESRDEKKFLDLKKLAKLQLQKLGVPEKNIEINPLCTYCEKDKYFSYRRDKPTKFLKTMIAVFGIKS